MAEMSALDPIEPNPGAGEPSSLLRKAAIGAAGGTLILAGVVMLVTPGPGMVTIAGGLAVLAREFTFADRAMKRIRHNTIDRITARKSDQGSAQTDTD